MAKARVALDGVAILVSEPEAQVLFVSSPKARGAATLLLPHYVSVCCDGPPTQTDFRELKGRQIDIWAPGGADGATWAAAIAGCVFDIAQRVRIINASDEPVGRDLPHYVAEGWDEGRVVQWAADHARVVEEPKTGRKHNGVAPIAQAGESVAVTWQSLALECNSGGVPHPTIGNAARVLAQHPMTAGKIWFDSFRNKIMQTHDGIAGPWRDVDDLRLLEWLQQSLKLSKIGLQVVQHAVELAAFNNARNSVVDWLESLAWDREPRLSNWLSDFLGAPNTEYAQAAGRNWLVSMVARAYKPGCQADHMPVLEGASGRGKSSALAVLGGEWYRAAPQAFGSKEFLEVIQGAWLVEIPDMVGFGRREHTQIISAITTRSDPYRVAYGRHAEDHPRVTIFVATSENDEYLKDSRGVRRYWPVRCADINLDALSSARAQLFAEATSAFKAGASWHEMPVDETAAEQAERQEIDMWLEPIQSFCIGRTIVTVSDLATECLKIERSKQCQSDAIRIAKCLRAIGFSCRVERISGVITRVYRR